MRLRSLTVDAQKPLSSLNPCRKLTIVHIIIPQLHADDAGQSKQPSALRTPA